MTTLTNADKVNIINSKMKNLVYTKYNLDLDIIIENAKVEANQIINQAKENIKLLKTAEEQSITYVNDILAKCEIEIKKMVDPLGEEQKFIVLAKLKKLNLLPDNTLSFIEYQRLVKLYTV